ncbi:MAG: hypothetical protein KC464_04885 [Myxococcales bacterium]|nr:hypothetical protein [Myxococcales bacterium]
MLEALHGTPDDVDDTPVLEPAALARMRAAIDRAFALAWRAAREHAKTTATAPTSHRSDLLTLARDALLSRISQWQDRFGPSLQVAHRDLADLSDDDLRTMLADLEELAERRGELA